MKHSQPKFQHDSDCCKFIGHFADHDLYVCENPSEGPMILARYGSDGHEYSVMCRTLLKMWLQDRHEVVCSGGVTIAMPEGLLTGEVWTASRALLLGLAAIGADALLSKGVDAANDRILQS